MDIKDTILAINVVEPELVNAVKLHSKRLGYSLKGLALINKSYDLENPNRIKDNTGLFQEIICDFDDSNELQKILKPHIHKILAATCDYESSIQPFSKVIPFLPYIDTPTESSLIWSTEKQLMRDRMSAYDVNLTPKYQYLENKDIPKLKKLVKDFTFPVIVKPTALAKSLLVTQCENMTELENCVNDTFKIIDKVYAREHRQTTPSILIEEFMQGNMYSTDAYVTAKGKIFCLPLVRVITAHEIGLPGFYSYRHIIPTGLSKKETELAFKASRSAIKALGLRSSTAHVELYRTPDGWKIIELGARIGGYRESLYREAYGIEHYYNDLSVRMGINPEISDKPLKNAAGFNIYADKEGLIESIEGLDEARKLSSVVFIRARAKAGDMALFANNGGDLIVDGILSNIDAQKLEKDVAMVRKLVKINIKS
jgi:biotin carboxylase